MESPECVGTNHPHLPYGLRTSCFYSPTNGGKPQDTGRTKCADRELNPGYELGKLMCYHYTTGAPFGRALLRVVSLRGTPALTVTLVRAVPCVTPFRRTPALKVLFLLASTKLFSPYAASACSSRSSIDGRSPYESPLYPYDTSMSCSSLVRTSATGILPTRSCRRPRTPKRTS